MITFLYVDYADLSYKKINFSLYLSITSLHLLTFAFVASHSHCGVMISIPDFPSFSFLLYGVFVVSVDGIAASLTGFLLFPTPLLRAAYAPNVGVFVNIHVCVWELVRIEFFFGSIVVAFGACESGSRNVIWVQFWREHWGIS